MLSSSSLTIPGADYRPDDYQALLENKVSDVKSILSDLKLPESISVVSSPSKHYRMRAEFRIWQDTDEQGNGYCFYAMFDKADPKAPVRIDEFPIAHPRIASTMQPLIETINQHDLLRQKLFQIEFLCSSTNELLITLIYHKALADEWTQLARQLESQFACSIIGRSRKQRMVLSSDHICEHVHADKKTFKLLQPENSFSQPNAAINQAMIEWLCQYLQNNLESEAHDLLEMYCGNGNFTLPLSNHFRRVLATEISKTSINFAKKNCELNDINNIEFVRLSGEETAQALRGERPFRRLSHLDLKSYALNHILVDPPRAGLDQQSLDFIKSFDTIFYISCNPSTLAKNLQSLSSSHEITEFAIFDQFPYTPHCECGATLKKKH